MDRDEGLQGTRQIEGQEDFIISHPSNVEDVISSFFLSDYSILLSAIRIILFFSQQHLDFTCWYVFARVCAGAMMCEVDFRLTVNKHCLCDHNYEARSTDMSCYIIYISVTTMHPLNPDFWQMAFLFEMFFISFTRYPKLMCHHPVISGCSCDGDEMNAD